MIRGHLSVRLQMRFYLVVALILVTLGTAISTGFDLFFRLIYVLALTLVFSYVWNWMMMRGLAARGVRRTTQAQVGDTIDESITVRNSSKVPKHALEVQDMTDLPGYAGGMVTSMFGSTVNSWEVKIPARKRGRYTLGSIKVSNIDPFGMFRRERVLGDSGSVLVFPRVHNLLNFAIPPADISGDSAVRRRIHNVTPHASAIRDYAPGDSLSRVHWVSSARLGKLMSKEFDLGRAAEVWAVVDLEQGIQAGELEESTDEYAVSIAASLAKHHIDAGLPVGLLSYADKRYFVAAETGAGQLQRIMQLLALSKAEGTTPLEVLLPNEEPLWSHLSTVLVITSSPRVEWVTALRELTRRGVKVVVILVDAASFGSSIETLEVEEQVRAAGLPSYTVRKGDDIPMVMSRRDGGALSVQPPMRPREVGVQI